MLWFSYIGTMWTWCSEDNELMSCLWKSELPQGNNLVLLTQPKSIRQGYRIYCKFVVTLSCN